VLCATGFASARPASDTTLAKPVAHFAPLH
jgi:hypothetical protein